MLFEVCALDSYGPSGKIQTQIRFDAKVCNHTNMLSFRAEGQEPRALYSGRYTLIQPHLLKIVQSLGFCAPGTSQTAFSPQGLCMCCSPCSTHKPPSFFYSCHFLIILLPIPKPPPPGRPPGSYKESPNTPCGCHILFAS